jgi:hypothetical protein
MLLECATGSATSRIEPTPGLLAEAVTRIAATVEKVASTASTAPGPGSDTASWPTTWGTTPH